MREAILTEDDWKLFSEAYQREEDLQITISAAIALYLRGGDGGVVAVPGQQTYSIRIRLAEPRRRHSCGSEKLEHDRRGGLNEPEERELVTLCGLRLQHVFPMSR
jgi:hypothetical protein